MSSRKRIQRQNPWQPTPAPDILQSRPFSNGKGPRESRLPTTNDILQTRPFSPRDQDVSTPKDTRSFEEKMKGAEFRYNGVSIPAYAPSEPPVVQREEEVGEDVQEQAEGETSGANISVFAPSIPPPENPILSPFSLQRADGLGQEETLQREEVEVGDEEKEGFEVGIENQQLESPPDDGTIQRKCAECEGKLGEKEEKEPIQAKLTVGEAGDKYEQEADAVAAQVVEKINVPQNQESVQRQSELGGESVPNISVMRRGESGTGGGSDVTEDVEQGIQQATYEDLIQRFSWSDVTETAGRVGNSITETAGRVGNTLSDAASSVGKQVEKGVNYLTGRPERERAERERPEQERKDPGNFCTPYTSRAEVYAAKTYLWGTLIPSATGMFGSDVAGLWSQYLSGRSSGYRTFPKGSNIANSFAKSNVIRQHTETLMNKAITRLDKFEALTANTWVDVPVEDVFTFDEINFPINFSNPFDIPGHIAGGVSGSDFGPDTRKLKGYLSVFRETDATGNTTGYQLKAKFEFEVKDAVDFCPGGAGAGLEQVLTIPASRLEASGQAFDVPFEVQFAAPEIVRTTSLSSSSVSSDGSSDRHRGDRQDVTRGVEIASRR